MRSTLRNITLHIRAGTRLSTRSAGIHLQKLRLTGQAPIICIDSDNVSEKLAGNNSDISARLFIDENDVAKFKT